MERARLARLSEGQRDCLRLVLAHKSSKDIGRLLGISNHTVDQRLKAAMRILGAPSRVEAAQLHAALERTRQPLVYQMPDIADPVVPATIASSAEAMGAAVGSVREERALFHAFPPPDQRPLPLPLPYRGGTPDDLTALQRLGWILAIVMLIALIFGIFVAGFEALSRLGLAIG